jgi:hypothetical protein
MIIMRDGKTRALELMLIIWQPHLLGGYKRIIVAYKKV